MPDPPAACQPLADELATLHAQDQSLAALAETLVGPAAWQSLAELGRVRAQKAAKQRELDGCVAANTATLTGTLTVIDVRLSPPHEIRNIVLWDVDHPNHSVPANMTGPMFGFKPPGALPENKAVTVQSIAPNGAAVGAGFDFRTGPLPAIRNSLPIEIMLLPDVNFDEATINAWAFTVQLPAQPMSTGVGGAVNVGPTTFTVSLATGNLVVTVHSVLAGIGGGGGVPLVSATPHPVSATLPVTVLPNMNPVGDPAAPVTVKVGDPTSSQDGGLFGGVAAALVPLAFGSIRSQFEQQITAWLNGQLPGLVAAVFTLESLPTGCSIAVRSVDVSSAGMSLSAVVGNLGTALSTFSPHDL
ncbi:hypothetical protein ACFQW6_13000 [Nocardioides sp. GCM10028917]|uniref:hypothetical protein n=1 Tax=Nocardioides sp. GCM10028917 TaxID=3273408 RepID=UPI00361E8B63